MMICDLHNGIDTSAISFPHTAETGLTANIPKLDGHISFGHFLHVEAHCGNGTFCKLS